MLKIAKIVEGLSDEDRAPVAYEVYRTYGGPMTKAQAGALGGRKSGEARRLLRVEAPPVLQPQAGAEAPSADIVVVVPSFQSFYLAYPRKEAPDRAERAWNAAIKKAPPAEIIAGLQRQLPELASREKKFIPHPATWLNGGHWKNEAAAEDNPYKDWPRLYDCRVCGEAHETRACPKEAGR